MHMTGWDEAGKTPKVVDKEILGAGWVSGVIMIFVVVMSTNVAVICRIQSYLYLFVVVDVQG
jgi:hypothetical protein